MKKYVKPELFFESFELSQQIAACKYDSKNTHSDEGCTYTGPNDEKYPLPDGTIPDTITIFLQNSCEVGAEGFCYHGSTDNFFNVFNS